MSTREGDRDRMTPLTNHIASKSKVSALLDSGTLKLSRVTALALVAAALLAASISQSVSSTPEAEHDSPDVFGGREELLWHANYETGDVGQWDYVTVSGSADAKVVTNMKRTGNYGNALTVRNDRGGVRMVVITTPSSPTDKAHPRNLPNEAYYSVWFYFPQKIDPHTNVFQWKQAYQDGADHQTRRLLYWIRADWSDSRNAFRFHLRSKLNNQTGAWDNVSHSEAISTRDVPLNTWVHLECYYRWSKAGDGQITCWQDGVKILDRNNIHTEYNWPYLSRPRQWTVNNYTKNTTPNDHTIYIDDAAIATHRIS